MKSVALGCALALASASSQPDKVLLFEGFVEKYGKAYNSESERGRRFQIFSENVDTIYESNSQNKSYTLGITENADRTWEEFKAEHFTGLIPILTSEKDRPIFAAPEGFTAPDSVDWMAKGAVTAVKNQGTCGSCWAFSTVGALEGAMHVAGRKMVELSMQQILACDKGSNGCHGGSMDQAFAWVEKNGLVALQDDPYLCLDASASKCTGMQCSACSTRTGETCIFGKCTKPGSSCNKTGLIHRCECPSGQCFANGKCGAAGKPPTPVLAPGDVTKYTDVEQTENALEAAVAQQPVSVAIEADKAVFQHYTGGVLTDSACGSALDHGVLAVGYGVVDGKKYWRVKNSWGNSWGDSGYINIERGSASAGGECGIRKMASFPTVKPSGNREVVV